MGVSSSLAAIITDAYKRTKDVGSYSEEELEEMNKTAEQTIKADQTKQNGKEQA